PPPLLLEARADRRRTPQRPPHRRGPPAPRGASLEEVREPDPALARGRAWALSGRERGHVGVERSRDGERRLLRRLPSDLAWLAYGHGELASKVELRRSREPDRDDRNTGAQRDVTHAA